MSTMIQFSFRRICLILWLLFITVGCDQATKLIARDTLTGPEAVTCCQGVLNFRHEENTGAFMSMGSGFDYTVRFYVFTVAVGLTLVGGLIWLIRNRDLASTAVLAWALILAGGFGNVIDRAIKGSVTDFLMIEVGPFRTGVFNVADMAISFGVIVLAYLNLKEYFKSRSAPAA